MKRLLVLAAVFLLIPCVGRSQNSDDQKGGQNDGQNNGQNDGQNNGQNDGQNNGQNDGQNNGQNNGQNDGQNNGSNANGRRRGHRAQNISEDQSGSNSSGGDEDKDEPTGPISREDALGNFETIVQAYVARKSPNGFWPYTEKSGKKWRLMSVSVDSGSVKPSSGQNIFSGVGTLRDARTGHRLSLIFAVDFSGSDWKVVAVKGLPSKRPPKPKAAGSGSQ